MFLFQYGPVMQRRSTHLLIMKSILPADDPTLLIYDLKGSKYNRHGQLSPDIQDTAFHYKDMDFIADIPNGLILKPCDYNKLKENLEQDCKVSMAIALQNG